MYDFPMPLFRKYVHSMHFLYLFFPLNQYKQKGVEPVFSGHEANGISHGMSFALIHFKQSDQIGRLIAQ
jgi:hypothetical protein